MLSCTQWQQRRKAVQRKEMMLFLQVTFHNWLPLTMLLMPFGEGRDITWYLILVFEKKTQILNPNWYLQHILGLIYKIILEKSPTSFLKREENDS